MWRGAVALVVLLAAVPAFAAQGATITASEFTFSPAEVTVAPGERVKLANAGGFHNFVFADGAYPANPTSSTDAVWDDLARTFTGAGDYAFVCGAHAQMTGVVRVREPVADPSPTPAPNATPAPGQEPQVRSLRLAATTYCARRCAVRVRIDLSAAMTVRGILLRRGRRFGRVDFGTVAAGPRTLRFRRTAAGRRLVAGRYALRLQVAGEPQPALRFRVR